MSERMAGARVDYDGGELDENGAPDDPVALFEQWYADAEKSVVEPNAMVLSTVDPLGQPASRTVLLKGLHEGGFDFYTNYISRKAAELAGNPACALLFGWYPLHRQVRVEGMVARVSAAESDDYFARRPRDSQLGAWASTQSAEVNSRAELDEELAAVTARFDGVEVPRPPHWGGYRVTPHRFEFWQGRHGRMHDRLVYRRAPSGWEVVRLAP